MGLITEPGRDLELKCPWCGYHGKFQKQSTDIVSLSICILLLLAGLLPGIIYGAWHSTQEECPTCRAKVPRGPF